MRYPDELRDRAIRLYQSSPQMTQGRIENLLGVDQTTVSSWLAQENCGTMKWAEIRQYRTKHDRELALSLYATGLCPREIVDAGRLNVHPNTVYNWVRQSGLARTKSEAVSTAKRKRYRSQRRTAIAMRRRGMSYLEIGKALSVDTKTVWRWINA